MAERISGGPIRNRLEVLALLRGDARGDVRIQVRRGGEEIRCRSTGQVIQRGGQRGDPDAGDGEARLPHQRERVALHDLADGIECGELVFPDGGDSVVELPFDASEWVGIQFWAKSLRGVDQSVQVGVNDDRTSPFGLPLVEGGSERDRGDPGRLSRLGGPDGPAPKKSKAERPLVSVLDLVPCAQNS